MRFLHLADLHFGKSIYGMSLIDSGDQTAWVNGFLELAGNVKPDAVVIAGDVYDRNMPSKDAVLLFDDMLTKLNEMNIKVLMVAGNHDSGHRLSFAKDILSKNNIFISGTLESKLQHITFSDVDEYGPITFWLVPYIFPALVAQKLEDDSIANYDVAMRRLIEAQNIDFSKRNVLVAHQNVTANGVEVEHGGSESMVGGVGQIDYSAFDGFDYVALGHIHSAYSVGRREVRYAGSPLCYHFNEIKQKNKGPVLVEINEKGQSINIETLEVKPLHAMREIKGTFEEVKASEEGNDVRGEYVRIVITDRKITPEMSDFFRELFRKRDSFVLELVSEFREFDGVLNTSLFYGEKKLVEEYFQDLYSEKRVDLIPNQKDVELFSFIGEQVRNADLSNKENEADSKDVDKLLEFILGQEA